MNRLPKYWVVKAPNDRHDKDFQKVITYMNSIRGHQGWNGDLWSYYGCDGNEYRKGTAGSDSLDTFQNNPTLLTIDEFLELSEEFEVPDKWYVLYKNQEEFNTLRDYIKEPCLGYVEPSSIESFGIGYSSTDREKAWVSKYTLSYYKPRGWKEITFDQFKKYVLKQEDKMKELKRLPDEYIVECMEDSEKCLSVWREYYGHYTGILGRWQYVICTKDLKETTNKQRVYAVEDHIRDIYEHLPVIPYDQWEAAIKNRPVIGYKVVKQFPGGSPVGTIMKIGEGIWGTRLEEAPKYPEFFQPVYEEPVRKALFGDVEFTIKPGSNFADTSYGAISKEQIEKIVNYINNPPQLLSFSLSLHKERKNLFDEKDEIFIGCKKGTVKQLFNIYKLFDK